MRRAGLNQTFVPLRAALLADAGAALLAAAVIGGLAIGLGGVSRAGVLAGVAITAIFAAIGEWQWRLPGDRPAEVPRGVRVEGPARLFGRRTVVYVVASFGVAEAANWLAGPEAAVSGAGAALGVAAASALAGLRVVRWERRHGRELIGPPRELDPKEARRLTFARTPVEEAVTTTAKSTAADAFGRR